MKKLILLLLAVTSSCCAFEVNLSGTDESSETRREKAFEDWIPLAENQSQFDQFTKEEGKFPIFSEREYPKVRSIFIEKPKGLAFWTWASMDEDKLFEKHQVCLNEGYVLVALSAHVGRVGETRYWATWVNQSREKEVLREMKRLGLTQATIGTRLRSNRSEQRVSRLIRHD